MRRAARQAVELVRDASDRVREGFDAATSRALHMAVVSGAANAVLGVGKVASGIVGLSVFACVNGLYTICMAFARLTVAGGATRASQEGASRRFAFFADIMLTAASVLYLMYAGWSYFHPSGASYSKNVALAIAAFTFVEIGLNVKNLVQTRKSTSAVTKAIRIIGVATSVIALALTQEAILSFQGADHDPSVNAYVRCLTGGIAALLGVYVVVRARPGGPTKGWE